MTEQQFKRLYDQNITKIDYDNTINLIGARLHHIVINLLCPNLKRDGLWYDYDNCSDGSNGRFDPSLYKDEIYLSGCCILKEPYSNKIPTRWLWTQDCAILDEYNSEIERHKQQIILEKQKRKQKREERKIKKEEMKNSILSKLTKDEIKYVKFK